MDKRIDPLGAAAILTDTQFRLSFLPHDEKAPAKALQFTARAAKMEQLSSQMLVGKVAVQIKAGFAPERVMEFTPAEIVLLMDAFDKFITELPGAARAEVIEE